MAETSMERTAHYPGDPRAGDSRPAGRLLAGRRALPVLLTGLVSAVAALLVWAAWQAYVATPWTRDGTVRVYVVTTAPEVAGRIVQLPIADDSYVHKGDVLMVIDPTDYAIAVDLAMAQVMQAKADLDNKVVKAERRQQLTTLSTSQEEKGNFTSDALTAKATYQQAVAQLARARVNLERTKLISPVNGWITNLQAQLGNYADVGQRIISIVNADSFWIDGYFEETNLASINEGYPARMKLERFPIT